MEFVNIIGTIGSNSNVEVIYKIKKTLTNKC